MAAAVLILGVIVFQAVDQARFRSAIPGISDAIREYDAQATEALDRGPEQKEGSAFLKTVEQFWAEPETVSQAMRYYDTPSSFYKYLEDDYIFLPLSCRETLQSCRIRKNGPGSCIAELVVDSTVWLDQYGSYLSPFGVGYAYDETAEDYSLETETPESVRNGSQAVKLSCQLNVFLQLSEKDGSWKINYSQMYAMSSSSELVDIQEVPV